MLKMVKRLWLYNDPLYKISPDLFMLCEQDISVFQFVSGLTPITFCRWLSLELRNEWENILKDIHETQLVPEEDNVLWKLENKRRFSVKL